MDVRRCIVAIVAAPWLAEPCPARGEKTERARAELQFAVPEAPPEGQARWTGDWAAGLEEAKRRNVSMVAMLGEDDKPGVFSVWFTVYSTRKFAEFAARCVMLAAFRGDAHERVTREVGGREVEVCALFGIPCAEHGASWTHVHRTFARREYWQPLHVFVDAAGAELTRIEGHETKLEELEAQLAKVTAKSGSSLGFEEYRALLKRLRGLVDARERRGRAAVHAELAELLPADPRDAEATRRRSPLRTPGMIEFVRRLKGAILLEGEGLVEDAAERFRSGDVAGARALAEEVARGFKGLKPAEDAVALLKKLPPERRRAAQDGGS